MQVSYILGYMRVNIEVCSTVVTRKNYAQNELTRLSLANTSMHSQNHVNQKQGLLRNKNYVGNFIGQSC